MSARDLTSFGTWSFARYRNRLLLMSEKPSELILLKRISDRRKGLKLLIAGVYRAHYRVEHYEIKDESGIWEVAIKYEPKGGKRLDKEINAINFLKESGYQKISGVSIPELITINSRWGAHLGVISHWSHGGDLFQFIKSSFKKSEKNDQLKLLLRNAGEILGNFHRHRGLGVDVNKNNNQQDNILAGLRQNCFSDPELSSLYHSSIKDVKSKLLVDELKSSLWIHGDCFSYQFFLEHIDGCKLQLGDWGAARIAPTGASDVAQFWISLEMAFNLDPARSEIIEQLWREFVEGYGEDLDKSLVFQIACLQALNRFMPFGKKFRQVVPYPFSENINNQPEENIQYCLEIWRENVIRRIFHFKNLIDEAC